VGSQKPTSIKNKGKSKIGQGGKEARGSRSLARQYRRYLYTSAVTDWVDGTVGAGTTHQEGRKSWPSDVKLWRGKDKKKGMQKAERVVHSRLRNNRRLKEITGQCLWGRPHRRREINS